MNATASDRSRWERTWDRWMDASPVLTRELLVAVRTPLYVRSVVVAPLLVAAAVLWVRACAGADLDPENGRRLFWTYAYLLSVTLGVLGAVLGSTVLVQEREGGGLDALKLTSLGIHRIVLAKFAAVLLGEAAVVLFTLPVLVFIVSLGGLPAGAYAVAMAVPFAAGALTASVGMAVSAGALNGRRALVFSVLACGVVGIAMTFWVGWVSSFVDRSWDGYPDAFTRAYFDAPRSAESIAALFTVPAFGATSLLGLAYAVATAALMDESDDRGRPLKRWTLRTLAFGALTLWLYGAGARGGERGPLAAAWIFGVATLMTALVFAFAGEPSAPTRRMQARARSALVRVLSPQCLAPSIALVLAAGGAALLATPVLTGAWHASDRMLAAHEEGLACGVLLVVATLGGVTGALAALLGATWARLVGGFAVVGFLVEAAYVDTGPWCLGGTRAICQGWTPEGIWAWTVGGPNVSSLTWTALAIASLVAMRFAVRLRAARAPQG